MTELIVPDEIIGAPEGIDDLHDRNIERLQALATAGIQVGGIDQMRSQMIFDLIIDKLAGPKGTPEREAFELEFESKVSEALEGVESQIRMQKLLAGGPVPPPMTGR